MSPANHVLEEKSTAGKNCVTAIGGVLTPDNIQHFLIGSNTLARQRENHIQEQNFETSCHAVRDLKVSSIIVTFSLVAAMYRGKVRLLKDLSRYFNRIPMIRNVRVSNNTNASKSALAFSAGTLLFKRELLMVAFNHRLLAFRSSSVKS